MCPSGCRQFTYAIKRISFLCGCSMNNLLVRVHAVKIPAKNGLKTWSTNNPGKYSLGQTVKTDVLKLWLHCLLLDFGMCYEYLLSCSQKMLHAAAHMTMQTDCQCLYPWFLDLFSSFFFFLQFSTFTENSKYWDWCIGANGPTLF